LTISQSTLAVAVHAHAGAEAVTITLPVPPPDGADSVAGAIENVHGGGGGAACDTVKICPAIVSVPVRGAPGFASTLNPTAPLPVPEAPLATVIDAALVVAVHAHVGADAVTRTDPDEAVSATF
jgi:hypothetical protein